jgi:type III secretion system YscJ/HrcJ family lipoprotein
MPSPKLRPILAVVALALSACSVPVSSNLSETDANQALVALEKQGISAWKERDPEGAENTFRVVVSRDDASSAALVLTQENLPPGRTPGVLDAVGQGSVVPSRLAEHARWIAGTSGELERSLRVLDGVISVRVHLAVPPRDALSLEQSPPEASASVLIRHRGATPPLPVSEVQRLVAGAVPGLTAEQVSVVMTPAPAPTRIADRGLAQFGPIAVARSSMTPLRAMVGAALAANLLLLGCLYLLWTRLRRTERELLEARAGDPAQAKR